jgi:ornithine cyclodeaminase
MRVVDADELRAGLPMRTAIDALERAFAAEDPSGAAPLRTTTTTAAGSLLTMPAAGAAGVGVKLVTLSEANPARGLPFVQAVYVLFDAATQEPEAVIDGAALTALRTAAVSGLATRLLANPDAARLVLFGAGVQAASHVEAMRAVRPVDELVVVTRTRARGEELVARARTEGIAAELGSPDAVAEAELVCTCTTSTEPLFDGERLAAGAHVNAVGAYLPDTRELDTATVRRARVVVETRGVAAAEAGDLLIPIAEGSLDAGHILADLHEVAAGRPVRTGRDDVTAFVSVGMAFEDLVVARALMGALA